MRTQSKQFENWVQNESALSEQDITGTRRVLEIMYASKLYLDEQNVYTRVEHLLELTRMVLGEAEKSED